MKKIGIVVLLTCVLVSFSAVFVNAQHSMSLTGPSKVYAGDSITVTYCAGGDIYGGTGKFSYDSSILTLTSSTASGKGGCTAKIQGDRFMFYKDNLASPIPAGTPVFELKFKVSDSAAVGKKFAVNISDVTFTDGERDIAADGCSYNNSIARPLSANCYLSSLEITGVAITPEFASGTTEYTAEVAEDVDKVEIKAATQDANARWKVVSDEVAPGETTPINVVVTAENGTTRTYIINVTRPKSGNAALSSLTAEGYSLTPEFSSDVYEYRIKLNDGILPVISAEAAMTVSTVTVGDYVSEGDSLGSISVKVTAQNGTELVYKVIIELPANVVPETAPQAESTAAPQTNETVAVPIDTDNEGKTDEVGFMLPVAIIAGVLAAACVVIFIIIAVKKKKQQLPPPPPAAEAPAVSPADDNLDDEDYSDDGDYDD